MENKTGRVNGFHHVCVYTRDIDESIRFYGLFGFKVVYKVIEKPELFDKKYPQKYALIRLGNSCIELLEARTNDDLQLGVRNIIGHIGFDVTNIDELYSDLKSKGVKFNLEEIRDVPNMYNGIRLITLNGPSGEGLTLYEFNEFDYDSGEYENLKLW